MKDAGLAVRSAFFWTLSVLHFFPVCTSLVALGAFVEPRRFDPLVRRFMRNTLLLTGARLRVRRSPGFDPDRPSFFVGNHVNIFDPFVAYSAVPQFLRGLELESHFDVPVYGWMMKRFGNVPVPVRPTAASLQEMKERCRKAIASGTSILTYPEGTRSRSGKLGPFRPGVFRMAREFGVPIVPMTQVGAYELKRVDSWMLRPSTIVVHLHDTIDTTEVRRGDEKELRDRVWRIVNEPLSR